jgi:phosphopantothenoylcysteine decarboxylase/phosphopantothenate--cysteine ligase
MKLLDFRIIVTAGPTIEWLDPVRYITNPSSGKIGFYLAHQLGKKCRELIYIAGLVGENFKNIDNAKNISVEDTREMLKVVKDEVQNKTILIMAAAPMDFRFKSPYHQKIKKSKKETLLIELLPNPDILKEMAAYRIENNLNEFHLIGFAAETHDHEKYGNQKLQEKSLEMIFINEVYKSEKGFSSDINKYIVINKNGEKRAIGPSKKEILAQEISIYIEDCFSD